MRIRGYSAMLNNKKKSDTNQNNAYKQRITEKKKLKSL